MILYIYIYIVYIYRLENVSKIFNLQSVNPQSVMSIQIMIMRTIFLTKVRLDRSQSDYIQSGSNFINSRPMGERFGLKLG